MIKYLLGNPDLIFALVLIAVALLALVLSRLNMMPAKGWPFLIGAALGITSLWFVNRAKARILKKKVEQLDGIIKKRKGEIEKKSGELESQERLLEQAEAEFQKSRERLKRSAVEYSIKDKASYEQMSDEEIRKAFNRI